MRNACVMVAGIVLLWGQGEKRPTYVGVAGSYLQMRLPARGGLHSHWLQPRGGWGLGGMIYRPVGHHWGLGLETAYHRLHASSAFSVMDTVFTENLWLRGMAFAAPLWGEIALSPTWVITASLGPQMEYFYDISYEAAEKIGPTLVDAVYVQNHTASMRQGSHSLDEAPFHPLAFSVLASAGVEHHWPHHFVTGIELRLEEGLENFFTQARYQDTHADFWTTAPTHQSNPRGHSLVTGVQVTVLYELE